MVTMTPEVQAEYDAALLRAVLRHGEVRRTRDEGYSFYTQSSYGLFNHVNECGVAATGKPYEDMWYEFAGTFAPSDAGRQSGVTVDGVTCRCGKLTDRTVRWTASPSEMIEAVFTEAFSRKQS